MQTTVPTTEILAPRLNLLQRNATVMAVIGLVLSAVGFMMDKDGFFHSWLYAYLFWTGVTVGSLGLLLLHHTVGGGWGFVIRRPLEAATRVLPVMFLLFIPILLGMHQLFEWSRPEAAQDVIIQQKVAYLNTGFFLARWVFYFVVWYTLAHFLNKWGSIQDQRHDERNYDRLTKLGAGGLVLTVLVVTFAAFDWIMSIEPHWYSSIIGLLYTATFGLSAMSMMLLLLGFLAGDQPFLKDVPKGYLRDLGNLTLAMIMLWGYTSVSQWIITYHGNTAEEITWYIHRSTGGWQYIAWGLIACHFALPFLVLLIASNVKRDPKKLRTVATYIVCVRLVDLYWWITPTFKSHIGIGLADIGTPLLIGGIWLYFFATQLKGRTLYPAFDPRLEGNWPPREEHAHG